MRDVLLKTALFGVVFALGFFSGVLIPWLSPPPALSGIAARSPVDSVAPVVQTPIFTVLERPGVGIVVPELAPVNSVECPPPPAAPACPSCADPPRSDTPDARAVVVAKPRVELPLPAEMQLSTFVCAPGGRRGGSDCVFRDLLFKDKVLYFVHADGAPVNLTTALPADMHISHDLNYNHWPDWRAMQPEPVNLSTARSWTNGAVPPPLSRIPVQAFARLNPNNIYHHLWDDMGFAHAMGCKTLARLGAPGACVPGSRPPFALIISDQYKDKDEGQWSDLVAERVWVWPNLVPPAGTAPLNGVTLLPLLAVGSRGACTHRRHCTDIIDAAPVRLWQLHLRAMHNITTQLPPPGETQTAVIVSRVGRRRLTNIDEIVELMPLMGFVPKVVGPFKDMTLGEQFNAFANASLAVFVFGAELGPAWVGLPDGACAAVLHPAGIVESLSYWIADKVGIKVTTMIEVFKKHDDPRLAPETRIYQEGKVKGLPFTFSDVWLYLFNFDFRIDPKDLWRQTWCTDAPWPPD